ncbi:ATP-binding protein [Paenibacillus melissococcoides]|uniref:ATP-binding protein n=1 Tax=Paenibacillus melissococcoides TaxID=2912268 RepID=A0ABN8UEG8_9BACL|nr:MULTISPECIES: ATP-binding protein [Paenibacillus]MEB9897287.1 ATP-binding protein [Bacillus cereus]GIO78977.1 hypothetical protein J6TS7_25870 [Paenibacillus dendritiformis]CAH8249506.1 ATP-binding protein [Paenibacillus melissococcoides]CAH8721175.1 ATP-binding protein [Paenibacillus melissococcoides]
MSGSSERYTILKGFQIPAEYQEQIVPEYQGNPFIEAISPRLSRGAIYQALYSIPRYSGEISGLDDETRLELIQQITLPITSHFDRYRNLYNMIKIGYQSRNPTQPIYHRQMAIGLDRILVSGVREDGTNLAGNIQTAQQCAEIGLSGMGKSKTYDKLLQLFPQVIHHSKYKEQPLPCKQVVWLKIECPSNKSVGALCRNFYTAVDDLLGTTYYEDLAEKDGRIEVLAKRMAKVAGLISLGVLVIDEIQRINRAQSGGDNKMIIDFMTELTNSIGIPIIMIGTFKAMYLFRTCLANCRRGVPDGYAENIMDRMKDDWEWEQFIENLWDLQYTKTPTKLSNELKVAMYYHTIGIPDFAVKLFMHVQSHAILYSDDEVMTLDMIEEVSNKTLRLVQPIFERIRKGEDVDPEEFEDLKPDWIAFNRYLLEVQHRVQVDGQMSEEHRRILLQRNRKIRFDQMVSFAVQMGCTLAKAEEHAQLVEREQPDCDDKELLFLEVAKHVLGEKQLIPMKESNGKYKNSKRNRTHKLLFEKDDIRKIVQQSSTVGKTIDEALREGGMVAKFDEFIIV